MAQETTREDIQKFLTTQNQSILRDGKKIGGWKGQITERLAKYDLIVDSLQVQMRTLNETLFKVANTIDGNCQQLLTVLKKHEQELAEYQESFNECCELLCDYGKWLERLEDKSHDHKYYELRELY